MYGGCSSNNNEYHFVTTLIYKIGSSTTLNGEQYEEEDESDENETSEGNEKDSDDSGNKPEFIKKYVDAWNARPYFLPSFNPNISYCMTYKPPEEYSGGGDSMVSVSLQ